MNNHTKITCKCSKCGEYFTRKPSAIIDGVGCTNCYSSKLEQKVEKVLSENNILFEREKCFKWLKKQRLDFYLPDYNLAIECQGKQHFIAKKFFGGENGLEKIRINDIKKYSLCKKHNIEILYIGDEKYDYFAPIIVSVEDLLTKIKNSHTMKKTFKKYYPFPLRIDEVIPFKAWCAGEGMSMAYDVLQSNLSKELYQELVDIINGTRPYNDSEQWGKPDKYVSKGCEIFAEGSNKPIICVRGWGRLIGVGGFKLTEDEAVKIQDEFVEYIIEKLNNKKENE